MVNDSPVDADAETLPKACRYCFEEDGKMISPCACVGSQRWVHFHCLLRWQRSLLEDQPDISDNGEQDSQLNTCNVCLKRYTCESATLLDVLKSFTGPEVADLIDTGCIISAHHSFSAQSRSCFSGAAFFIVEVAHEYFEDFWFEKQEELMSFKDRLLPDLELKQCGRTCELTNAGSLAKMKNSDCYSVAHLAQALQELEVPAKLVLHCKGHPNDLGNDLITAVNLDRPIGDWRSLSLPERREERRGKEGREKLRIMRRWFRSVEFQSMREYDQTPGVQPGQVQVFHYIGGPCDPEKISSCIVPHGFSYTTTKSLDGALRVAHEIASTTSKKCNMRVPTKVPVLIFWGKMQWYRTRLLGEIASGIWGLCVAQGKEWWRFSEIQKLSTGCDNSLVFAAQSSLTLPHIAAIEEADEQRSALPMDRLERQSGAHQSEVGAICPHCGVRCLANEAACLTGEASAHLSTNQGVAISHGDSSLEDLIYALDRAGRLGV